MRVLVCGGRGYDDFKRGFRVLDELRGPEDRVELIIHGAAAGADHVAETWAQSRQINYQGFPAKWDQYGSAAGPIRNALMVADGKPDLVVAFPGGRGTADMIKVAKAAGVPVQEVSP